MKAFVITGPGEAGVHDVAPPTVDPGEVVVDVQRGGVCCTDIELYTGEMHYLHDGFSTYPLRIGHEWMGTVSAIGDGVDDRWLGRRVTGDTMPGCGVCRRCRSGYQPVCEFRGELGIRDARPGALAEQAAVPAASLRKLPDAVDDVLGALVAPGGNALRSVQGAALVPGDRDLVLGAGTIGLLVAMFVPGCGCRGPSHGPQRPIPRLRAHAAVRRRVDRGEPAGRALGRGGRGFERATSARQGAGARRARQACRLRGPRRQSEPHRHPYPSPERRHRGRDPERVAWVDGDGRGLCERRCRPAPAGRGHRRP
jgi:hypothetical protein